MNHYGFGLNAPALKYNTYKYCTSKQADSFEKNLQISNKKSVHSFGSNLIPLKYNTYLVLIVNKGNMQT